MVKKAEWNKFILENNGLFLQSWEWGEFQESLGRKIWRLGDCESWTALIIRHDLPMGKNYLYCPAGPVIKLSKPIILPSSDEEREGGGVDIENQHPSAPAGPLPSSQTAHFARCNCFTIKEGKRIFEDFLKEIKNIAKQENSIFLKIEPFWEEIHPSPSRIQYGTSSLQKEGVPPFYKGRLGGIFQKSDGGQRILKTLVLDLDKSEEELLAEMKQKTRYNIKMAKKNGVKIRLSAMPENDFKEFWQLMQETAKRNKIKIHPREHYEKLFSICHSREGGNPESLQAELFLAEHQNKIIAANIVAFFGNKATYLHGASDYEHRHLMAPYLLQWEQIKEAKKSGCKIYDFWGIDETKWPGITRFKAGFGGEKISYIGVYDYVFSRQWYWIYRITKRFLLVCSTFL